MEDVDEELARLVQRVRDAKARMALDGSLSYCRAIADVVAYLARKDGRYGARARAARHLGMTRQNVGVMLSRFEAATGGEHP